MSEQNENTDPAIVGNLTEAELQWMVQHSQRHANLLQQIGFAEVQKFKMMAEVDQLERGQQGFLREIGSRLQIPEGVQWDIVKTEDGFGVRISK